MVARPEKEAAVADIKEKLERSKAVVLTDYRGLNVHDIMELRRKLREAGIEYKVVKNTLAQLAAEKAAMSDINTYLTGPTAMAFGFGDPVAPAKIISEFAREHKELEIKGGMLEGKVIGAAEVKALASLPSREVMLARVASAMQAPIAGIVGALSGCIRNLVYALDAVRKQKEGAAA
ncbi:MAG TPA: 50S ribosomal protein L10 [Firmicutes bacterium]|nr:50S ribosomal protein L10 [Bacillota bacterium]